MSFAGITQFKKNLDALMASEAFKNADDGKRMRMGAALLGSRYGADGSEPKDLASDLREKKRRK